jgi:hypothetical protein
MVNRETIPCALPPNASVPIATIGFPSETGPKSAGFAVLFDSESKPVAQHRCFTVRFHELHLKRDPQITMTVENGTLTLSSDVFCWGVCLDVGGELPLADNCFDLLPGIRYSLPWDETTLGEPRIVRLGNRDALP